MAKPITLLTVTDSERLSPGMVRLHLSGDLAAFADNAFTDRYVKLVFGDPADLERGLRPTLRTYTVVEPDVAAGTLKIDFVVHGDSAGSGAGGAGVAGPWAAGARPGDTIHVRGPSGAYAPDPAADWHLLAGDEAALPAIRQSLAALPRDAVGYAVLEVDTPAHEQSLPAPPGIEVTWLHHSAPQDKGSSADGDDQVKSGLADAVRALPWREGRVHAFVHGEAQVVMHQIRPYLFIERGVPRDDVSISGYWRDGRTEEEFREWKAALAAAETGAV